MKKMFAAILVVLSFLVAFCLPSAELAQAQTGSAKKISDIKIKGNKAVSTATIMNKLKIKPGDAFEELALNNEIKRLYATGFFSDVFVETDDREEGVLVIFTVMEKPTISGIKFSGNGRIAAAKLMKKIQVKEGDLLDFNMLGQDVINIRTNYTEQGYSNAQVDYRIETDPDTGAAVVVFVIDEGMPFKIRKIGFEGNKSVKTSELLSYMSTKTAWWFIRKGAFDEDVFKEDQERIQSVYRSKGFLDAKVTSRVEYSEDGKSIYLTVIVDEGKQYYVGDLKLVGTLAFPEEDVMATLKMKPGDAFDYKLIKEDMDNIRAFYFDRGYMNAEVDLQNKYNPVTDKMDLIYKITAHEEVYVGKVNVLGNTKTRDKVIRRELRVYPGEMYNGERLKTSKERIYNLGFFEDVYLETVPTDKSNVKDLDITVKETKTGELSFGGGFSSVDAFIGFAQIRQRNFDILNFPSFTGGGQDLTIRGEIGSTRTNYLLSWTDPWIFDLPYLFGFDLYRTEYDKSGLSGYDYYERRTGGSLRLGKDITDNLATGLVYNLEEVKLTDIPDDASADLQAEAGTNTLSRVTWNLTYDTRDNKFSPTKGIVTGMSLENVGGFIGGDKDFVKGTVFLTYYRTIIEEVVLELKGRGGMAEPYDDTDKIPIYERFFAGGATTIRGYKQRSVGPRDSRDGAIAIGGDSMVIGNAELAFPLYKQLLRGAVFYDVGAVHTKAEDIFETSGYVMGAGVGVRVKTPIGPVKLDYGYPLSDNHDDKKEGQFYFSVSHGF
ncbi:MAG: outer membrane protein assembly factor BamA [Candidatus Omnitrophica bacterium]|nr:outer membrane protein assembly factor BamA [Candidatus Omnitrophota bacterium]MDD5488204.1 outer membrane protein assembly factor BamA [Candidatus Omnitrophota bacterium]